MIQGKLYDGTTAHPHEVAVAGGSRELLLSQPGGWSDRVNAALLKRVESPGSLRLRRTDMPGWRLLLPAEGASEVAHLLGPEERYGRWIDRVGLLPALAVCAVITAVVVAIGYLAPAWIAPHVPMSWEREVGSAIVGDFGTNRCRSADGQRALEAVIERVAPGATKGPDAIKVAALDVPMFNAAALPGGYIVVFKPAITDTDPNALAGILAHEVAHVRRRHVTEALIRELGIGSVIRFFAGSVGANAEQLVAFKFTRGNEAQADADAIRMLKTANVDPRPTSALFNRLSKEAPEFSAQFLQSHPANADRSQKFGASFDPHAHYTPVISQAEDTALLAECSQESNRARK